MMATVQASTETSLLEAARSLAAEPYRPPDRTLPAPFANLTYDAFRGIRPRAGDAAFLPQGDGFAVDLMPPGLYFPDRVMIERVVAGRVETVRFSPQLFDFEPRYFDAVPDEAPGAGFTGLRLRHPINAADQLDEIAVFQGGSYFRAIGRAMAYGLSARALALGTGGPEPEEFPRFTRFRLHEGDGSRIRLEAVIDSPSLTAHFETTLAPGDDTLMDVTVTVFPRKELTTIGIAPLTSMYLKGPMHAAVSDDFRPRVHDTDVLVIENGARETLWRPIANPARVESSAFFDESPRSFGLFQTARRYDDFEDTEARYHHRPSAIVTPKGNWGRGAVVLVEIPTADEFLDNIVAFWRPEDPLQAGNTYRFDYTLRWTLQEPEVEGLARVLQSRSGEEHDQPGVRRFVVDFDVEPDGLLMDLSADAADPASVFGKSLFALPEGRGSRATFLLKPNAADTIELRLVLRDQAGMAKSPVWLHRWTRKRDGGA
ncbi:MAG: glucan biosynthesis protein [Devosiaceae bacterium]|nr:glucan biosynthesis protein [Devosiaceae bacterium MH13]